MPIACPSPLHYCARTCTKAAFLEELASAPYAERVHLHFDDGDPVQRLDPARDFTAVDTGAHLYVCGPTGFTEWVIASARKLGFPDERIHKEFFSAKLDTSGNAFEVVLSRSGETVPVTAGRSIAAALKRSG